MPLFGPADTWREQGWIPHKFGVSTVPSVAGERGSDSVRSVGGGGWG